MPNMQTFVIGIVIVGTTLVIGIYISATIQTALLTSAAVSTVASNAAGSLVTALSGGTSWITILVVVGFAVIVLGMLSSGLGRAAGGSEPVY